MRKHFLAIGLLGGALAGCSQDSPPTVDNALGLHKDAILSTARLPVAAHRSAVASLPDRGELLAYKDVTPVKRGSTRWYPVNLSEEHALRAIATGKLRVNTPEGRPLEFRYQRHVEHKNGNWTWVGRMDDAPAGREAVLTFGEDAVFGSIAYDDAEPLRLAMSSGRTWLVQTDPILAAASAGVASTEADFLIPGISETASGSAVMAAGGKRAARSPENSHTSSHATVDIALGYTAGLAASLGGDSQAVTRLTYLVDLTNQAYAASGVDGELRLVRTVRVEYPDATPNRTALFELTGVTCASGSAVSLPDGSLDCTTVARPAALAPLIEARETYGADVIALVRRFENPESGSCGIGWMLGGGQREITSADAAYAMSVVSDTSTEGSCRDDMLAHEVGHNLGLQHDRESAQGNDDSNNDGNLLDPEEYGRFPYSFGYSTGTGADSFYTIMAIRRQGQTGYLVFSNPNLTSCGGQPCGVVDQADNARALNQTIPVIATFRAAVVPLANGVRNDVNGDGRSDILWYNAGANLHAYWLMSGATTTSTMVFNASPGYRMAASGDFNGDGLVDELWTSNASDIWLLRGSPNGFTTAEYIGAGDVDWRITGAGDVNGDGIDDVLWHNATINQHGYWLMNVAGAIGGFKFFNSGPGYRLVATGDFNGDGLLDQVWTSNARDIQLLAGSANGYVTAAFIGTGDAGWRVTGSGDMNADGVDDVFWHNPTLNQHGYWLMNGSGAIAGSKFFNSAAGFGLATTGDFDGDGRSDQIWTNASRDLWLLASDGSDFTATYLGVAGAGWAILNPTP